MIDNIFKEHTWIETALETIAIAVMFEYTPVGFVPIHRHFPPHPFNGITMRINDPYIPLLIGLVAMFGLVVSIWHIRKWHADWIRNILFMLVYSFLLIIFIFHEIGDGGHIGAMTLLCGTTWLRITIQWVVDVSSGQRLMKRLEGWR